MSDSVFTTVYNGGDVWEVQLLQSLLESESIESYVDDSHMAQANWLLTTAIGGVKLRVRSEDADRAREIIAQAKAVETPPPPRCPKCGAGNPGQVYWPGVSAAVSFLLLGVPLLFPAKHKCRQCGEVWKDEKRNATSFESTEDDDND